MQTFEELGLSNELVQSLTKSSILNPTEIQSLVIPTLLEQQTDLIGLAQTGTGKTAAFGLPLLDLVDSSEKRTQAVILAPTRELAQQIAKSITDFAVYRKDININVVFGGAPIVNQIRSIKKNTPHILVATPGRLMDMLNRKVVFFDAVQTFVLDEADEMLNMGFKEDIYKILSYSDEERNVWLFSATMAREIRAIVKEFMQTPVEFSVNAVQEGNKNIEHQCCVVKASDKQAALERFIDFIPSLYGLVFCRTKRDTQKLADNLNKSGYQADALHGDLSQSQRDAVMNKFRNRNTKLLVATDVAARGIDVEDLSHVFHFALPDDMAFYTHRSGRTARAGKKGYSLSIMTSGEERKLKGHAKKLKFELNKIDIPKIDDVKRQHILSWHEEINNVEISEALSEELIDQSKIFMYQVGTDEFLKKVLSLELKKLSNLDEKDFSAPGSSRRDRSERRDKADKKDSYSKGDRKAKNSRPRSDDKGNRFFINMGKMDKISKGELRSFLSETASINEGLIDNIAMEKRHSYFDVDESKVKAFAKNFKDLEIDGRELRVNRDQLKDQKRSRKR